MSPETEKGIVAVVDKWIGRTAAGLLIIFIIAVFNLFGRVTTIELVGSDIAKGNKTRLEEYRLDVQALQSDMKYMNEKICEIKELLKRMESSRKTN